MRQTAKQDKDMENLVKTHVFGLKEFWFSPVDDTTYGIKNTSEY